MAFKAWPLWRRVLLVNILIAFGVGTGFATSGVTLSPRICVPVAVGTFALLNLVAFSLQPRISADRALGKRISPSGAIVGLLRERPLMSLLLINQLIGVSQLLTLAASLMQSLVGGLPSSAVVQRTLLSTLLITATASIWLFSAVGLWRSRPWAWWLALALNSIHVLFIVVVQFMASFVLKSQESLVGWNEIAAAMALIILMLPAVRTEFRGNSRPTILSPSEHSVGD